MDIAVDTALSAGSRGVDTAHNYENEESLGNSLIRYLPEYGLKGKDIFLETKNGETLVNGIFDGKTLCPGFGKFRKNEKRRPQDKVFTDLGIKNKRNGQK